MVKGRLVHFSSNVARLSLLSKNIFPFSYFQQFGYDNSPNEGTVCVGSLLFLRFFIVDCLSEIKLSSLKSATVEH